MLAEVRAVVAGVAGSASLIRRRDKVLGTHRRRTRISISFEVSDRVSRTSQSRILVNVR